MGVRPCVSWGSHEDENSPCLAGVGSSKWVTRARTTSAEAVLLWVLREMCQGLSGYVQGEPWGPTGTPLLIWCRVG